MERAEWGTVWGRKRPGGFFDLYFRTADWKKRGTAWTPKEESGRGGCIFVVQFDRLESRWTASFLDSVSFCLFPLPEICTTHTHTFRPGNEKERRRGGAITKLRAVTERQKMGGGVVGLSGAVSVLILW